MSRFYFKALVRLLFICLRIFDSTASQFIRVMMIALDNRLRRQNQENVAFPQDLDYQLEFHFLA